MNKKNIILTMVSIIIAIVLMVFPNEVKAVTNLTNPLYFGIIEYRNGTTPDYMGYAINNPGDNGSTEDSKVAAEIWQMVRYNNGEGTGNYTTGNYYCVRAGVGFSNINKVKDYNISYDLKSEKTALLNSTDSYLRSIANNGYYEHLLALTDLMYLKGVSTEDDKKQLLEDVGIYISNSTGTNDYGHTISLTDSDIEAVQQAAIWYFTNHDDSAFERVYNNYEKPSWLFYRTLEMSQNQQPYTSFSSYNYGQQYHWEGKQRQEQAALLYDYLIEKATENAVAYSNGTAVPKTKVTLYTCVKSTGATVTQPIIEIEKLPEIPGNYKLTLRKKDASGNVLNRQVTFTVNDEVKTFEGVLEVCDNEINASNYQTVDTFVIKETVPPNEYCGFDGTITVTVIKKKENNTFKIDRMDYTVVDANGNDIKNSTGDVTVELIDNNIFVNVKNHQNEGKYNLTLVKEDAEGEQLNSKAIFEVNGETKEVVGKLIVAENVKITAENVSEDDVYVIKELEAPDEYCEFNGIITVTVKKKNENGTYKIDTIDYKVTDVNGNDITNEIGEDVRVYLKDNGNIYVEVKNYQEEGSYNVTLVKEDAEGKQLDSKAIFEVNGETKEVVGRLHIAENVKITAENVSKDDVYVIKELEAPDEYCEFNGIITVTVTKKNENGTYKIDEVTYTVKDENGNDITEETGDDIKVYVNENGNIYVEVKNYQDEGSYNLTLVKEDAEGEQLDSKAIFEVNGETKEVVGRLHIAENVKITAENVSKDDVYVIKELEAPDEYCEFNGIITVTVKKKNENGTYKIDTIDYKVTDVNGNDITNEIGEDVRVYLKDNGNIYVEVKNYQEEGSYNVTLVKEDAEGEQLDSKAIFEVNGETKEVVGRLHIAENVKITAENVSKDDVYVIKELEAPDEYCEFDGIITVTVKKKNENGIYKVDEIEYKVTDTEGNDITESSKGTVNVYLNDDGNIFVEVKNYQFDLKLVKRIVEVNGVKVPERIENIDITQLANGTETTAKYDLNKEPVSVKKGDIVKYTLRVYNEGEIDGYASEITEDVPEGLEFIWSKMTDSELDADTTLTEQEKAAIKYNQLIWDFGQINKDTNKVETVTTDYLAKGKGAEIKNDGANLIKAFDSSKEYKNTVNEKNPDYREVSVYMKVISEDAAGTIIRNEAAITEDTDSKGKPVDDRDSDTEKWVKYEDDEDYDRIVLKSFDLSLRKFIIAVSKDDKIEDEEYLKKSDGTYKRAPQVDTSKLNTTDADGKLITTAIYNHTKEPLEVMHNDFVVYMIRVYNEGDIDGYASEITDHLPPYLQYVDNEFNKKYGWSVSGDDKRTVKTTYLEDSLISKATKNSDGKIVLEYKEVPIMCKVTNDAEGKITNIADITKCKDENKKDILDRDSEVNNVKLPDDKDLPNYKDDETGDYIPGQQDDDDFEKLVVKVFDLALRKFITGVNDNQVTSRIPQVKFDEQNNKLTYEHTKVPVDVTTNDIVVYTIRVYNEGEVNGFASRVSDDIPDGLQYLPTNDLNKEYRWVMYDGNGEETQDVSKAVKITTDYLSKEQGEERMKKAQGNVDGSSTEGNAQKGENPALLKAFDKTKGISETNPDYADVMVAFKVVEPNSSDRVIVNSAQISDDTDEDGNPVDDIDSTPDEWIEGEDDQDKEYIKLSYFDLALRKWVTHAIVIENGTESVTQTGHKPEDDPEDVVKVELHRKKINSVVVKFKYSIRITNEGDIAGYAKEITDYVPQGLKFVAADNPGWTDEGNNVISTRKLENTLLQPGESADVEVLLTWINGNDNLGLKTNIAEISEDYNDRNVPDRDSTPDNRVWGEDDIDDAPVLLSVATGQARIYFALSFAVLIIVAGGIMVIKRFVL